MNAEETIKVLSVLKASGAKHFKSSDFEVSFDASIPTDIPRPVMDSPAVPPVSSDPHATEKLKGLIETLKLDDSQLLDKVFPAGAGL